MGALTGQLQGYDLRAMLRLLELLEAGAPWSQELIPLRLRVATLERWLEEKESKSIADQREKWNICWMEPLGRPCKKEGCRSNEGGNHGHQGQETSELSV